MIAKACRTCEKLDEKDIIYTIGYTNDNSLKSLWLVYGDCFCADKEIYERIKNTISDGINSIPNVDFKVAQNRKQVFFIGFRKALGVKFEFPKPFEKREF